MVKYDILHYSAALDCSGIHLAAVANRPGRIVGDTDLGCPGNFGNWDLTRRPGHENRRRLSRRPAHCYHQTYWNFKGLHDRTVLPQMGSRLLLSAVSWTGLIKQLLKCGA